MKRLALCLAFAASAVVFEVATPAAYADAKCGSDICAGSPATQLHVKGNLVVDRPILPGSGTTVLFDGGVAIHGPLTIDGQFTCGAAGTCGSVALTSASPSTATVTVPAGVTCACWPIGTTAAIAAAGCAANVSSTTLTLTGPNTVTTTMRYMCFK